eukprot:TRINITY_DN4429_c0_g1_i1.p1 TRINITY_DN4429_c0_g1~~TRINITY_DN4429_c0_g1_i1.p1  ORF type:complete len:180 (+),score=34.80 TRINITY_DN4429_c0_g1_i1:121-660(+)
MASTLTLLFVLLTVISYSQGHFLITKPATRGFSDDDEPTPPCGGYNDPLPHRTVVQLGGTLPLAFTIEDEQGSVIISYAGNDNPVASDYIPTGQVVAVTADNGNSGAYNINVGTSNITVEDGSLGTFQILFTSYFDNHTFDSNFYQCIDVEFQQKSSSSSKTLMSGAILSLICVGLILF